MAPAFLSDEWLAACNGALGALGAPGRAVVVTEVVTGAPEGCLGEVTLVADGDGVRLVAGHRDDATAWLTLAYADAEALNEGRTDPARALTEGKVRVRGDLRAVVDATALLAAAHAALRGG